MNLFDRLYQRILL